MRQLFLGELEQMLKALGYKYTRNTLKKYERENKIDFTFHRTPSNRVYIMDYEFRGLVQALDRSKE